MKNFYLRVISSNRIFYEGLCEYMSIPVIDGTMGIMADHEEMFITLAIGELKFRTDKGEEIEASVSRGFVEIANNRATVLAFSVERPEEIDVKRAQEAKERAEEQLRQKQSIQEYHISKTSLARAINRLKVSSHGNTPYGY